MNPDQVYEDITDTAALKKSMMDYLDDFNNTPGYINMDLVLFMDAIQHGNYFIFMCNMI